MDKKSSSAIGEAFELRTKSIIERLLEKSELQLKVEGQSEMWVVPRDSRTFHHKRYKYFYGCETDTDISIEESTTDNEPKFLIVIECKCYTHKVGIDEIQEFSTRLNDLNATKGIFISSNNYQSGALKCAEAHNIALVRINDNNEVNWLLHRIVGYKEYKYQDCIDELLQTDMIYHSVIIDGCHCSMSFADYFMNLLNIKEEKLQAVIPYLTDEDIKMKAKAFLGNKPYVNVSDIIMQFCKQSSKERIAC